MQAQLLNKINDMKISMPQTVVPLDISTCGRRGLSFSSLFLVVPGKLAPRWEDQVAERPGCMPVIPISVSPSRRVHTGVF